MHTHPHEWWSMPGHLLSGVKIYSLKAFFSIGDLYTLVRSSEQVLFMGLVEGRYNLFAFWSRQTIPLSQNLIGTTREEFTSLWSAKTGDDFAKTNIAIAQAHSLVLYQGRVDQELKRIFPK